MAKDNGIDAEEIIKAFLLGVARGAAEQFPSPEQAGKSIGRRVTRGRSKMGPRLRKPSQYNLAYSKNFKKVQGKYKKKDGSWAKDGFKRAQKEAHRLTKKEVK